MYCARKKAQSSYGINLNEHYGWVSPYQEEAIGIFFNYRNHLIGQDDHTTSKLEDVSKEQEEDKQGCKELFEVSHLYNRRLKTFHVCHFR